MTNNINNNRNYSIDLLRIISMLMIVILHIIGLGGVYKIAIENSSISHYNLIKYFVVYGLDAVCYCAVDCFGIISGFVGIESNNKYNSFFKLWTIVEFYSIFLSIIPLLLSLIKYNELSLLKMFFPIICGNYWYFTAYFVLGLLIPYINILLKNLDKRKFKFLIILITLLFSVISIKSDCFKIDKGYHCLWLISLYFIGAYIRLHGIHIQKINKIFLIFLFSLSVIIVFVIHCSQFLFIGGRNYFLSYTSPFILINAIILLCIFYNLNIKEMSKKTIMFITPSVFPVYLIHEHFIINPLFIFDKFKWILQYNVVLIPILIFCISITIFIICIILDKIRIFIFTKTKINKFIDKFANKINEISSLSYNTK